MNADEPTCPECAEDEESTVELVYSMGGEFDSGHSPWDEPGTAHREGGGGKTVHYFKCSNGHRWAVEQ